MEENYIIILRKLAEKIRGLQNRKRIHFNVDRRGISSIDLSRLSFTERRDLLILEKEIRSLELQYDKMYYRYIHIIRKNVGYYRFRGK